MIKKACLAAFLWAIALPVLSADFSFNPKKLRFDSTNTVSVKLGSKTFDYVPIYYGKNEIFKVHVSLIGQFNLKKQEALTAKTDLRCFQFPEGNLFSNAEQLKFFHAYKCTDEFQQFTADEVDISWDGIFDKEYFLSLYKGSEPFKIDHDVYRHLEILLQAAKTKNLHLDINMGFLYRLNAQYTQSDIEKNIRLEKPELRSSSKEACSQKRSSTDDKGPMCQVCKGNVAETIFSPCNHLVSCEKCAEKVSHCPICRQEIVSRQKVYY